MFFFGRGVSAFFNQFFKWLFWNKTGQKVLFTIVIFAILVAFVRLGEVSAVEEVTDINYEVYRYYDSVVNDFILRMEKIRRNDPNFSLLNTLKDNNSYFYLYYGNPNGTSVDNAKPLITSYLYVAYLNKGQISGGVTYSFTPNNYDYLGVTGFSNDTLTKNNGTNVPVIRFDNNGNREIVNVSSISINRDIMNYMSSNLREYINYLNNNNDAAIQQLLTEIEEELSNTTPDQETEDSVVVDSSAVDSISTASVDNVFSSLFTTLGNKFNSYDLSVTESWVWNLMGTRITFYSDTIYKVIKGTFMETLITSLWLYITGHYAFAWLSKLIHSIKDGSILNGIEMNEVLTKEIL